MRCWAFSGGLYCFPGRFSPRKSSTVRVRSSERLILVKPIPRGHFLDLGGSRRSLRCTKRRNQADNQVEPRSSGGANETEFHFSPPHSVILSRSIVISFCLRCQRRCQKQSCGRQ